MRGSKVPALIYAAMTFGAPLRNYQVGYITANGEYHPRKHTKQSYRSQQRAAKKRKK